MRKLLLLFATVLLSAAAAANSVPIDYGTGNFLSGTFTGSFSTMINVSITGSLHTIDIQTGTLVKTTAGCPPGSTCWDFTGGSVTVDGTVFKDSISGGITIRSGGSGSISAILMPEAGVGVGSADASFIFHGGKISAGSENVSFTPGTVPEPASLLLFGTGLAGLAVKFHRKLRKES